MHRSILLFMGCFIAWGCSAQRYEVINYHYNSTPTNGIKIKTNIPFQNGGSMPTIHIEGYFYGETAPVGLDVVWYVYNNSFIDARVSSWGAATPPIYLSDENGLITIFMADKPYFPRFKVTVYAQGMPAEDSASFSGWSVVDEALGGTNQLLVPYLNRLAGTVSVAGKLGVNKTNPTELIDASDGDIMLEKANGVKGEFKIMTRGANTWNLRSDATTGNPHFQILNNENLNLDMNASTGNVGIGKISAPSSTYKLDVNGNIRANKIVVNTTGADFVFDATYRLPALGDINQYIKVHHHLPGLEASADMRKEGVDVEEVQTKLLQKVEELTLYVLQQDQKIKALQTQVEDLQSDRKGPPPPIQNPNRKNP